MSHTLDHVIRVVYIMPPYNSDMTYRISFISSVYIQVTTFSHFIALKTIERTIYWVETLWCSFDNEYRRNVPSVDTVASLTYVHLMTLWRHRYNVASLRNVCWCFNKLTAIKCLKMNNLWMRTTNPRPQRVVSLYI